MGHTFFIADDDADDQELFIKALKVIDVDCRCITAVNGIEALEKLQSGDGSLPDFIFLDLNMPRLNGKQCLAAIKKDDKLTHIPVIIYSTSAHSRDVQETKELGAFSFLQKPNKFDDLAHALTDIIDGTWK
jgi:CheY-like chemotaxis protein